MAADLPRDPGQVLHGRQALEEESLLCLAKCDLMEE